MPSVSRNVLIAAALGIGLLAAIIGFVVREPIERSIVLQNARHVTGLDSLDASHLEHEGDTYVLSDARAATADGSFTFAAPEVRISGKAPHYDVVLSHPNVRFDPAAYRDADRAHVRDGLASAGADGVAKIAIDHGTLAVGPVAAPAVLYADAIDGALEIHTSRATFDGSISLEAKALAFPIVGKTVEEDGAYVQTWSAASIPVEPFVAFFAPNAPSHPVGGLLRDLTVDDGPHFRASARLENVTVSLGDHALHGLHGKLIAIDDGIGTGGVAGFLDSVTFRAVGEVHDLRSHYRWLAEGTNDLRGLARLATTMAAEPTLRGPVELEAIAPGLAYGQYHMLSDHGPIAVSVLSADPAEKTLRIDTAIAEDHVVSGGERTSAMGLRTGAVGGVNGDYFDIGRTYQPQGMLIRNGELVRGPTDRAVLAIDRDKHVTVGEFHMTGVFETSHGKVQVTEFNDWPAGYVSVITPNYGKELKPADATFVALTPLGGTSYRVARVEPGIEAIPASFGVAIGKLAKIPIPTVGETVKLRYATNPPLTNAVAAIGGGPILLKDGLPYDDPHAPAPDERDYRWPVVALAVTKDGYLDLIAVDGRHPERSVGMTRPDFAVLLERFGGTDAMALDSGGSVTLVARAPGDANVTVRNIPSDNSAERWVSDALFLYSDAPRPSIVVPSIATTPLPEERPTP